MIRKPAPKPLRSRTPYLIGILSDIHFGITHEPTLAACEEWCKDVRPDELFLNGDTFDFSMLSTYPKSSDALTCAIEEVKIGVPVINRLHKYTKRIRIQYGNHDKRWEKTVLGANAQALKGSKGLTLADQCFAQGMDPRVEWCKETAALPGVWLSNDVVARHGDLQAGRFGGSPNLCTNKLNKNNGVSELVGHHHKAQLAYRTAFDRTAFVMSLPTMADYEDYAPAADWQRGWAVLSMHKSPKSEGHTIVQPSLVLVQEGLAMWGGRTYGKHCR